jgi:hypothetical protein
MAEAQGIEEIAGKLVRALQLEMTSHNASDQPELKGWLDGLEVAFRYRHRLGERWTALAGKIIEALDFATAAAHEVASREGAEFEDLSRQLRSRLETYKGEVWAVANAQQTVHQDFRKSQCDLGKEEISRNALFPVSETMMNQEIDCKKGNGTNSAKTWGHSKTLLTVEEVADMLRVSDAWVRDRATRKAPRLPMLRVGKQLRARPTDIEDWIDEQKNLAKRLKLAC